MCKIVGSFSSDTSLNNALVHACVCRGKKNMLLSEKNMFYFTHTHKI